MSRHVDRVRVDFPMSRAAAAVGLAVLLGLPPSGCSSGGPAPGSVQIVPRAVIGKVVHANGRPLAHGRVVLVPLQAPFLPLHGDLKRDGTFTLTAAGLSVGVSHGEFHVRVEPDGYFPGSRVKPKGLNFPAKYLDDATSGLKATITSDTQTLPTFELK
jgi:hypothetical protein